MVPMSDGELSYRGNSFEEPIPSGSPPGHSKSLLRMKELNSGLLTCRLVPPVLLRPQPLPPSMHATGTLQKMVHACPRQETQVQQRQWGRVLVEQGILCVARMAVKWPFPQTSTEGERYSSAVALRIEDFQAGAIF